MPAVVSAALDPLAAVLDRRTRDRFWSVFFGLLLCREKRRTASAWFRAAGIGHDFRRAYHVPGSVGRRAGLLGTVLWRAIERVAGGPTDRAVFARDDTVTKRFGPCVEGAGGHRNPTPGPAAQAWVYGHVWVTLARVVRHTRWGAIGLPVRAARYVRRKDIGTIPPEYRWPFRTKLEWAAERIGWLAVWVGTTKKAVWLVMDGAYAKRVVPRAAQAAGATGVSRLRRDAALWTLPDPKPRPGKRGRKPVYGNHKISLAKRAAARGGWATEEFDIYNRYEAKAYKTFPATRPPAGGVIRVVRVKTDDGWVAYFCTDPDATATDILGLVADRAAVEKDQADYPSRRRWVGTRRVTYHRRDGVARAGRLVPATAGRTSRRNRMSDTPRRPTPPRA
jgi:hypothetical protein